ncbi:MAG: hypothetical protein NTY32_04910 [Bacteroidia bacterium]|nr:hypothetical protein [Bacteroidia bacterium]
MKVLVQHLENLLPEHDCVVVPGLGGFVQNEVQARIQPGARLFYPASKEIGFNHRLKFNDGLLAQSYQEANSLSFEEANLEIQKAVQEIQEKLEAGKFIRLGRTGTLFMIDQQLIFRPDHHNHFYPEAYGLTPFTYPLLKKPVDSDETVSAPVIENEMETFVDQVKAKSESNTSRDEFIHIRFNRSRVRQLVAGVAVFLFLILFPKPAGKPSGSQEASMMHTYLSAPSRSVSSAVNVKSVKIAKPSSKDSARTMAETRKTVPTPGIQKNSTKPAPSLVSEVDPNSYYIIVSAFIKKTTAKRWIAEHEGEPFLKDVGIIQADGHARVFVKSFTNSDQASAFLSEFTSSHSEYAAAWIYSAKND